MMTGQTLNMIYNETAGILFESEKSFPIVKQKFKNQTDFDKYFENNVFGKLNYTENIKSDNFIIWDPKLKQITIDAEKVKHVSLYDHYEIQSSSDKLKYLDYVLNFAQIGMCENCSQLDYVYILEQNVIHRGNAKCRAGHWLKFKENNQTNANSVFDQQSLRKIYNRIYFKVYQRTDAKHLSDFILDSMREKFKFN